MILPEARDVLPPGMIACPAPGAQFTRHQIPRSNGIVVSPVQSPRQSLSSQPSPAGTMLAVVHHSRLAS